MKETTLQDVVQGQRLPYPSRVDLGERKKELPTDRPMLAEAYENLPDGNEDKNKIKEWLVEIAKSLGKTGEERKTELRKIEEGLMVRLAEILVEIELTTDDSQRELWLNIFSDINYLWVHVRLAEENNRIIIPETEDQWNQEKDSLAQEILNFRRNSQTALENINTSIETFHELEREGEVLHFRLTGLSQSYLDDEIQVGRTFLNSKGEKKSKAKHVQAQERLNVGKFLKKIGDRKVQLMGKQPIQLETTSDTNQEKFQGHLEDAKKLQELISGFLEDIEKMEAENFSAMAENELEEYRQKLDLIHQKLVKGIANLNEHVEAYQNVGLDAGVTARRAAQQAAKEINEGDLGNAKKTLTRVDRLRLALSPAILALPEAIKSYEEPPASPDATYPTHRSIFDKWVSDIGDLEAKIKTAEETLKQFESTVGEENQQLKEAKAKLKDMVDKAKEFWEQNIEKIIPELKTLRSTISDLRSKIDKVIESGDLTAEVNTLNEALKKFTAVFDSIVFPSQDQDDEFERTKQKYISEVELFIAEIEGSKAKEKSLIDVINRKISEIEADGFYIVTSIQRNPIEVNFADIRNSIDELRKIGSSETIIKRLEERVAFLEFRVVKGSIIKGFEGMEFNDDGAGKVDNYNRDVIEPLLSRIGALVEKVGEPFKSRFAKEYDRFKKEMSHLIGFYLAAKVIRDQALGLSGSSSSDELPMSLPSTLSVYGQGFSNGKLRRLLRGDLEKCLDDDLKCSFEESLNKDIRKESVRILDPKTKRLRNEEVGITPWAQAMRDFDLFFQGRTPNLPEERNDHYVGKDGKGGRRRTFYSITHDEMHLLVQEFEMARLGIYKTYLDDIAAAKASGSPEPNIFDDKYDTGITKKDAVRAFNASVMLMRPFVQAPSSFNKGAPAYYAFNPDYAISEFSGGTTEFSALLYFSIFGYCSPELVTPDNTDGVLMTLDKYGGTLETSRWGDYSKKLVNFTSTKNLRSTITKVLKDKDLYEDYGFLADLPLMPLQPVGTIPNPNRDKTKPQTKNLYRAFVDPLSGMLIRDSDGKPIHNLGPTGRPEDSQRYYTGSDVVNEKSKNDFNPNGDIMYELLPLTDPGEVIGDTDWLAYPQTVEDQLSDWTNVAKNIEKFRSSILYAMPHDIAEGGTDKIAALTKNTKYVLTLLEPYAMYLRTNEVNLGKLKRSIILTVAFIQGILLLAEGKSITEIKVKFSHFNVEDSDKKGLEAVLAALEAGFSVSGMARNFVKAFTSQFSESLRLK